jgi:hypothetical protein
MLSSGNGRHRRPRPTPAAVMTVATVAATGAGIALPLLGAGSAQAAGAGTWDKVAVCETGGLWSADAGNGFYGGLAITQDTWNQYGGGVYAKRPDLASRAQQITVAEKILHDLGPNAWPGCESATGLLTDTATPDVNPGDTSTPVPDPSGPTGIQPSPTASTTGSGTPGWSSSTPSATTTPATPTTPVTTTPTDSGTPSGTPSTSPVTTTPAPTVTTTPGQTPDPTGTGAGRHGKPYDPTDEQLLAADQASRTEVYSTTGKSVGSGSDKGDTKGTSGTSGAAGSSGRAGTDGHDDYTVGFGDSLSGIASAHHVDGGWHQLFDTNHKVIGNDPNLIKPGQTLNLG